MYYTNYSISLPARIDTRGRIPERMKKKPELQSKSTAEPQSPPKPRGRIMSIFQDRKGSTYPQKTGEETKSKEDGDIYGGLDASLTLIIHGLESDWIEEEMADDDDFK